MKGTLTVWTLFHQATEEKDQLDVQADTQQVRIQRDPRIVSSLRKPGCKWVTDWFSILYLTRGRAKKS